MSLVQSMKKFYQAVADAIKRHFDMAVVKVVLVASPGFLKDDFLKWCGSNRSAPGCGLNDRVEQAQRRRGTHLLRVCVCVCCSGCSLRH
jgi:stalled ribosome rescue protein Dom34